MVKRWETRVGGIFCAWAVNTKGYIIWAEYKFKDNKIINGNHYHISFIDS